MPSGLHSKCFYPMNHLVGPDSLIFMPLYHYMLGLPASALGCKDV